MPTPNDKMQNSITILSSDEFASTMTKEANYFAPVIEKLAKK